MNTKNTIAVVLIALALGVYFLVFETDLFDSQLATTREREARLSGQSLGPGEPLPGSEQWTDDAVHRVRIEESDRPAIEIERTGSDGDASQWVQTEPVRFPLRPGRVSDMVTRALEVRYTATIRPEEGGVSLEELGLDPPRAVVTLDGEGTEPRVLRLGRQAGAGRAYLTLGGAEDAGESSVVYVVGDDLHQAALDVNPRELRSRTLASVSPGRIRRIHLTREGQAIELERRDGRWMLTEPVTGRADRTAAEELIRVISGATVERFVKDQPENLSAFALDDPSIVLTLEAVGSVGSDTQNGDGTGDSAEPDEETTTYQLAIGGPTDLERSGYFAMFNDAPIVFTLPESAIARLEKQANDLRDPTLTPVAQSDVNEITIERTDEGVLHFLRDEGAWAFGEPDPGFRLDTAAMDALSNAIFNTRADDYIDLSDHNLATPTATVEMAIVARNEPERLAVHGHEDDRLVIVREGESTGYIVDRGELEPLFDPALAYRDRTVLDLSENAIAEIRLTRSGPYPAEYHLARETAEESESDTQNTDGDTSSGEWKLDGFDEAAARNLIDRLTPLLAERWLAVKPDVSSNEIIIELTLADGAEHEVRINPETHTAQADHVDTFFEASPALADAVTAELREKALLRLDIEQIASIETDDGLTIRRDRDGRFDMSGGDGGELDEQRAAAMFNTMAGLRAERFVDESRAAGDPAATLTLTTTADRTHTLKVWSSDDSNGEPIGQLGEQTFTLNEESAEALTANPGA